MNFGHFSYLASILIFGLSAAIIWWFVANDKVKKNKRLVAIVILLGVLLEPSEYFALRWGAWAYDKTRVLNTRLLGGELESYLFIIVICFIVATATLTFAAKEDTRRNRKR